MRYCLRPSCGVKVAGAGFCRAHARPSAARRGYGKGWARQARAFLALYYYCGMRPGGRPAVGSVCASRGLERLATDVDHVVPHNGDAVLFNDAIGNWQALCRGCHARKTFAERLR